MTENNYSIQNDALDSIRNIISEVLEIPAQDLSFDIFLPNCPNWDSFHLVRITGLIMEHFGHDIDIVMVIQARSIREIADAIDALNR